jgi:hypothetical protein
MSDREPTMKEQRGEQVSGSVDGNRQLWRAQPPETPLIAGEHVESVGRVSSSLSDFNPTTDGPRARKAAIA